MDVRALKKEYIRVEHGPEGVRVLVGVIRWPLQGPVREWVTAAELPSHAAGQVEREIARILADRRYFQMCAACGEREARGLVGKFRGANVCHRCLMENDDIVF